VLAIELAGRAATGSFLSSLETLVGGTDLEISANGGVDETWTGKLATIAWNVRFLPVLEREVALAGAGSVTLYGIDPFSAGVPLASREPGSSRPVFVSEALAGRLGSSVEMLGRRFDVAGTVPSKRGEFVILDIALAQEALDAYGKLDRIDVRIGPGEDPARVENELRRLLPAAYFVTRPGIRSDENQRMLRAFRWNLRILSYVSLIVGAFLIYNAIAVSVIRRRPEIGILRALGTSRFGILWMFLGEALALGIAGSAAGLFLGRLMAQLAVGMIAGTVDSLYASSRPAPVELDLATAAMGLISGILVSLMAAYAPAREATLVPPTEAMQRGAHEFHARVRWRRRLVWASIAAGAALVAAAQPPLGSVPAFGYGAELLAILSLALAAPAAVVAANRAGGGAIRRIFGAAGIVASRSLEGSLARTSVITAALATAIAVMSSVGIMVGSFRETVQVWLEEQLRADFYVAPARRAGAGRFHPLPSQAPAIVRSMPGVEAVDVYHGLEFRYGGERARLGTIDPEVTRRYGSRRFLEGGPGEVIVSEPFARKHRVRAGDAITLPLGPHAVRAVVSGVYYDYSSSQGWVLIHRPLLLRHLPEQPATNIAIYVRAGWEERVERELRQRLAGMGTVITPNRELRRGALVIFDRTFAITYALEGVAIAVAMLGAASSLVALVLDRRREIGLLRYLGAASGQLRRVVLLEAAFLGFLANLLGLALGLALSLLLIFVINKQSFGWTIQFHPPAGQLAGAALLIWFATVVAGFYPARIATRLDPIEVIHEE
jgi:putative ABC transport system permease protein